MKVDEDHGQVGPPCLMEGQHRVVDQTLCDERIAPCEMVEFAMARGISDELAFCWWVPYRGTQSSLPSTQE